MKIFNNLNQSLALVCRAPKADGRACSFCTGLRGTLTLFRASDFWKHSCCMKVAAAEILGGGVWSPSSMLTARSRVISVSAFLDKQSRVQQKSKPAPSCLSTRSFREDLAQVGKHLEPLKPGSSVAERKINT